MKKIEKVTKELAKKFSKFLKELPEDDLYYLAQTEPQRDIWYECRDGCSLIGACFESRFCGGNDPIYSWKRSEDDTKRIAYVWAWKIVDFHEILWSLIQLSFFDIKEIYRQLGHTFPFTKAIQLFFEITKVDENNRFLQVLKPTHSIIDLTTDDKKYALIERKLRGGNLTNKQESELANFKNRRTSIERNVWLDVVLLVCQDLSKSEQLIADKLQDFKTLGANIAQFQNKTYSDRRKNRNDFEIRSEEWIDGIRYVRPPNRKGSNRSKKVF